MTSKQNDRQAEMIAIGHYAGAPPAARIYQTFSQPGKYKQLSPFTFSRGRRTLDDGFFFSRGRRQHREE